MATPVAHDLPAPAPYCNCREGVYARTGHDKQCNQFKIDKARS